MLYGNCNRLRGIRAYEKAGFIHEARLCESGFRDGKYCDDLIMSVLHSEWTPEK